jgi:uracil DNA glycosylase
METPAQIEEAIGSIPDDWLRAIGPAASPERLDPIAEFVSTRRQVGCVLPEAEREFAALDATPVDKILGSLEAWTRHGSLLLNTTLAVDEGKSGSHWRAVWPSGC